MIAISHHEGVWGEQVMAPLILNLALDGVTGKLYASAALSQVPLNTRSVGVRALQKKERERERRSFALQRIAVKKH